ncbi:MAG TPA: M15 family metallopeptidase [Actinomycetota bacterium]|nr:M15 family metallopeptidase [Actinomycetota bacterium]
MSVRDVPLGRLSALLLALAAGLAGGAGLGFVTQRTPPAERPTPVPQALTPAVIPERVRPVRPDTLLAWTPGGLPPAFGERVGRLRGVDHVVTVMSGTAWLTASFDAEGEAVDRPPRGMGIPLEVAGAALGDYAPFLPPADRPLLARLARGEALLGATSARLRGLGAGATLVFGSRRVRVAGVVADTAIGANEVFVSRETAAALGVRRERYLLIDPGPRTGRRPLVGRVRRLLPPGALLRVRGPGETPYFRHGDAVLPPVVLKELFGEFAGCPASGGLIRVDPAWERRHIATRPVPVLGRVRCHRALFPLLRGALGEVEAAGLASLVDPRQYGGCYVPRFLNFDPEAGLSHHAWGVAIDLNALSNVYGRTPRQDPRIVAIFERWGFTWGGRWLLPDGMHFEFIRFPAGS